MSVLFVSGVIALSPVAADDPRLTAERAFVSAEAQQALSGEDANVLCLARPAREKYTQICLTREQWDQAITLAEQNEHGETSAERRRRLISQAQFYAQSI